MNLLELVFSRCIPVPESGCWLFTGSANRGYGTICVEQKFYRAHRLAWEGQHGPIPDALHVLHKCDTPPCCNPDHLFLGTHAENMNDRREKRLRRGEGSASPVRQRSYSGTGMQGEKHPRSKLNPAAVQEIRSSNEPTNAIARRLGLAATTIRCVRKGKTWRNVK